MADIRWTVVALLVATVGLNGACDDGGTAGATRPELVDALVDGGVDPSNARCWVGETYDHLSLEDKRAVESADAAYDDWADEERVRAAGEKCLGP